MAFTSYSIDLESGSSQSLSRADTAVLDITGNVTLEGWVNLESLPGSGTLMTIMGKWTDSTQRSYLFGIQNSSGTYQLRFINSDDGSAVGSATVNITAPTTGQWYHYAAVFTAASPSVEFFVDGVSVGSSAGTLKTSNFNSTSIFEIGANNAADYFDGKMTLLRVWSEARTSTQVNTNKCTVLGATTNLAAEWTLNNVLTDNSGNGLTLTNNGSATFSESIPGVCSWVGFDASSNAGSTTDGSYASRTWNHTCSGDNRVLLVGCVITDGATVSSVTYNGVNLTRVNSITQAGYMTVELWKLTAPTVGTNSIVATFSASVSQAQCGAISFTGSSGTVNNSVTEGNSTGTNPSVDVSSASGNFVIDVVGAQLKTSDPAQGAGQTVRWELSGTNIRPGASSTEPGAGTVTMSWTGCDGDNNAIVAAQVVAGIQIGISVNDQLNITESVNVDITFNINVSDAITLTESVSLDFVLNVDVSDSITITESVTIENLELLLSVSDSLTVADVPTVTNTELGGISVSDEITITESALVENVLLISTSDSITLTESTSFEIGVNLSVSDALTITESVSLLVPSVPNGLAIMRGNEQQYPLGMDDQSIL